MKAIRINTINNAFIFITCLCFLLFVSSPLAFASPSSYKSQESIDAVTRADAINNDTDSVHFIEVTSDQINTAGLKNAVQRELDLIRTDGDGGIYRVKIEPGTYSFSDTNFGFNIYSNTILDCRGVTIKAGTQEGLLLRAGRKDDSSMNRLSNEAGGYDDYANITVLGGTWDGLPEGYTASNSASTWPAGFDGVNVRFGHAENIKLIGMTFKNNYSAHHLELGAVKNTVVADCEFEGLWSEESKERTEALQLDITHRNKGNFSGYWPFDDLPTRDTTVEYCSFKNVARGIGSHHLILGVPYNNITISNNTFSNIEDRAISAGYFTNSTIENNTMTNVQTGIFATCLVPGQTYLKIDESNYTGSKTINANLKISRNTITLDPTGMPINASTKYGIRAGGDEITNANASYTDYISPTDAYEDTPVNKARPIGKYFYSNVTITDNIITTLSSSSKGTIHNGIRADLLANSTLGNNTIDLRNSEMDGVGRGILVKSSKDITVNTNTINNVNNTSNSNKNSAGISVQNGSIGTKVNGNTINHTNANGVYIADDSATATEVKNNAISGVQANGIFLNNTGKVSGAISGNTITLSNAAAYGINVRGGQSGAISNNTIKGTFANGIYIHDNNGTRAKVASISSNTISSAKTHGIYLSQSDVTGNIASNTITSPAANGISISDSAKAATVIKNKINNAGGFGIAALNSAIATSINENTITHSKSHGIYAASKATATNINSNTISDVRTDGIRLRDGAKVTNVIKNKITNPGSGTGNSGIWVEGITSIKIDGNTITGSKGTGIRVEKSSKANVSNNTVKNSKMFGIYALSSANAIINKNNVQQSTDQGIYASGSAGTKITNNTSNSTINKTTKYEIKLIGSKNSSVTGNKYGPRREANGKTDPISYDTASKPVTVSNNTPINGKPTNTTVTKVPIYWLVHKKTGENLYTPAKKEADTLKNGGKWTYKGIKWYAPESGEAVYRLYNPKTGDHHYTKSTNEVKQLTKVRKTWSADFNGKPVFYSGGKVNVYRLYSDKRQRAGQAGTHRFETKLATANNLKKSGWTNEGALLMAVKAGNV